MSATTQSAESAAVAFVERARGEVNSLKAQVSRLQADATGRTAAVAGELASRISHAEAMLARAELSVNRIRSVGRVAPNPSLVVPQAMRAKRALAVLGDTSYVPFAAVLEPSCKRIRQGSDVSKLTSAKNTDVENSEPRECASVASRVGFNCSVVPIKEKYLDEIARLAATTSGLDVTRMQDNALRISCEYVFIASVWLQVSDGSGDGLRPKHVTIGSVEEGTPEKWSRTGHAVLQLLNERSRAALRFFVARFETGEEALIKFVIWLASHRNLFSTRAENRRLAFDASRGMYLPPCITPFTSVATARFTRGTIPLRQNSISAPGGPKDGKHASTSDMADVSGQLGQ